MKKIIFVTYTCPIHLTECIGIAMYVIYAKHVFYSMQSDCYSVGWYAIFSVAYLFCSVNFFLQVIHLLCVSVILLLFFLSLTTCSILIGGTITIIASLFIYKSMMLNTTIIAVRQPSGYIWWSLFIGSICRIFTCLFFPYYIVLSMKNKHTIPYRTVPYHSKPYHSTTCLF